MKRILLISPVPPPNGGIATWTLSYLEYFKSSPDYDITLVNTAILGNRVKTNKRVYKDEYKRYKKIKSEIIKNLNIKNIDIIHYNSSCTALGLIKDFLILKNIKGEKIVFHARCDLCNYVRNRLSLFILKRICRKSYKVLVLNTQSKHFLNDRGVFNVSLVPNFIDTRKIPNKIPTTGKRIIYTGRVSKEKGCDILFSVAQELPKYEFHLIGDYNYDIDISLKPENVFLHGSMTHKDTISELCKSDVFAFFSRTEGFSNSLVEAMAIGLPVIVSDVGANKDMIENKGGLVLDVDSILNQIEIIRSFLDNNDKRLECAKFNKEKAHNFYDINKVIELILSEYSDNI